MSENLSTPNQPNWGPYSAATERLLAALERLGDPALKADASDEAIRAIAQGADASAIMPKSRLGLESAGGSRELSALSVAVFFDAPSVVRALAAAGADPNEKLSSKTLSPLEMCMRHSPASAMALFDMGVRPDAAGSTAGGLAGVAIRFGRLEALKRALELGPPLQPAHEQGLTDASLAERAVASGQLEILAYLLTQHRDQLPDEVYARRAPAALEDSQRPYFKALLDAARLAPEARSASELLGVCAQMGADLPTTLLPDWLEELADLEENVEEWEISDSPRSEWLAFALRESPSHRIPERSMPETLAELAQFRHDPAGALAMLEALVLRRSIPSTNGPGAERSALRV